MEWNIAQAKQQFSEVVRLAAQEPQAIYNRARPVAVVVSTEEFDAFQQWKATQSGNAVLESLARLRAELNAAGFDGLETEPRPLANRPNAFEQMLDEEYGPAPLLPAAPGKARARGTR